MASCRPLPCGLKSFGRDPGRGVVTNLDPVVGAQCVNSLLQFSHSVAGMTSELAERYEKALKRVEQLSYAIAAMSVLLLILILI